MYMMKAKKNRSAFTLLEIIAVLTIMAMIMLASIEIYSSIKRSAKKITDRLESYELPAEALQRIAEDIDRMVLAGTDVKIICANRFNDGYQHGRLIIESRIYDKQGAPQLFEDVIWQSHYDADLDTVVLYRSHSGQVLEDKLLDAEEEQFRRQRFVPVCKDVTFFKVAAFNGELPLDSWNSEQPPRAVIVTLSFAEPVENVTGQAEVPEEHRLSRTIAVDRTRKLSYKFVKKEFPGAVDVNDLGDFPKIKTTDANDMNEPNEPVNVPIPTKR